MDELRFDISVHVMTLSSYRIAPIRVGHLNHIKRITSYLSRFRSGAIRIRTVICCGAKWLMELGYI